MELVKSNIPMPSITRVSANASKYRFAELEVGESFLVKDVVDVEKAKNALTAAINAFRKRTKNPMRLTVRSFQDETGVDVVGVWRMDDKIAA
jgi:hypothetical protein